MSKLERIKHILIELSLVSTSHGIPSMVRTKRKEVKLMWLILFLLCLAYGLWFVSNSIINYLNYDVVIQIETIREIPAEFPTITFLFNDQHSANNFSFEDRLISCSFHEINCNTADFQDLTDLKSNTRYFKFNSGKNQTDKKYSIRPGKAYGLMMKLFIGLPNDFEDQYDLSIYLHNRSFEPVLTDREPIKLASGTETSLIINRQFSFKLSAPFSNCKSNLDSLNDFDSLFYKFIVLNTTGKYNQRDCFDLCLSKYLIDGCNKSLSLEYSWRYLYSTDLKSCLTNKTNEFYTNYDINDYCGEYCPLECNTINYDIKQTFSFYPSRRVGQNLLANNTKIKALFNNQIIKYDDLTKSLISVNIFYEDLSYTSISEDAKMQLVDLVSNIGGLLGLFIGISFLSFGELIEVFFEILFIAFEKKTNLIENRFNN